MRILVGVLLLVTGVIFPIGMLFWLNGRATQQPALQPRQVGLLLALNGVLPITLILGGLGLISVKIGSASGLKAALIVSGLTGMVLLIALWWTARRTREAGGQDGG